MTEREGVVKIERGAQQTKKYQLVVIYEKTKIDQKKDDNENWAEEKQGDARELSQSFFLQPFLKFVLVSLRLLSSSTSSSSFFFLFFFSFRSFVLSLFFYVVIFLLSSSNPPPPPPPTPFLRPTFFSSFFLVSLFLVFCFFFSSCGFFFTLSSFCFCVCYF